MLHHVEVLSAAKLHTTFHEPFIWRHGRTEGVVATAEHNAFVTARSHLASISLHSAVITGGTCRRVPGSPTTA